MESNEAPDENDVKTVEVWKGSVRLRRELETRKNGVVVTHRIAATSRSPVEFQIVDPLPGRVDIEDIGFHPDYEPPHGRVDRDQAVMSGIVSPEHDLFVRYGIRLPSAAAATALEDLQASISPSIELSKPVDPESVDESDLETAAMTRSAGGAEPADGGSVPFFEWLRRNLQDDNGPESPDSASDDGGDADQPTDDVEEGAVGDEPPREATADSPDESPTSSPRAAFDHEEEEEPSPTEQDDSAIGAPDQPEDVAEWRDDESVAESLLHQLESGALTEEQERRLANALLEVLGPGETPRMSTEIRLQTVESKLQQFEAYADALAAIIDEHGPADEFLADIKADVESLEREARGLRRDLDRSEEAREALDDRLDAVADEVSVVTSRLERVEDRLESMRADHRSAVSALEGAVEELEPAAEEVDQLSAAVDALRDDLEDVRGRHRAIARALTGVDEERG